MKLFILKENLKTGLNTVERAAGRNLSLPILNNTLLTAEKNSLKLEATDLELALSCWVLAKIEKEGKTAVPARFLANLVSFFPKETISLEIRERFLVLESGNFHSRLKTIDPDDFPLIPQLKDGDSFSVNSVPFLEGLTQVVNFAAPSTARPEISGIFFIVRKDLITITATDSFRLAEKKIFFEKPIEKEFSFIVPQKAIRELINILSEKKGKLTIYLTPNQVLFELPGEDLPRPQIQILSRLIEGEYPDYQAIIPKKYETQAIFLRSDFLNQLRTAGLFSGKTREVKFEIDPKKGGMEISSQNQEVGQNQSFLPGKIKGEKIEISFNWQFLAEGLDQIKSPEVIFELTGEEGPALLKPVDDPNYLYIAMPLKSS